MFEREVIKVRVPFTNTKGTNETVKWAGRGDIDRVNWGSLGKFICGSGKYEEITALDCTVR